MTHTGTLIVGGGLSGLSLANSLHRGGNDFSLVEQRPRLGGRILSFGSTPGGQYDLGPSWYWSGQPHVTALIEALGLRSFAQHTDGDVLIERSDGRIMRESAFPVMAGARRIDGGMIALVNGLAKKLPEQSINTGVSITALRREEGTIVCTCKNADHSEQEISADRVVLALPPRLIAQNIRFEPALPSSHANRLAAIPTWMAGHAKAVIEFDKPIWRAAGLSGDMFSQSGPLGEIHDASLSNGEGHALFGFLGWPAPQREALRDELKDRISDQLTRLLGDKEARDAKITLIDWATEKATASDADAARPLSSHPQYGIPSEIAVFWDGRVILSSTETDFQNGGLLEGALAASAQTYRLLRTMAAVT